ncbi:DNA-binding protein [Amycolatopsis pigmentata]|uniref:DNA-binding protein n=1 Tax=Amycolatopsis pigmentata TaxID=450801 RepID=A0ABW5FZB0_9PSEU
MNPTIDSDHPGDNTTPVPGPISPTVTTGPPLLYTPAEAAEKLATTESWLRRKAGLRLVPCTFIGKRLRFSDADLQAIIACGRRPAGALPRTRRPRRDRHRH